MKNEPIKIIVHHTGDASLGTQFGKIDTYHKQRGFTISSFGYYVGYHYLIERDGVIKQARKLTDEGCHTIGENWQSIGVALAGNFDTELPTNQQRNALGKLCYELSQTYKIPIERVVGHRTHSNTSCPGRNMGDDLARYAILKEQLSFAEKLLLWLLKQLGL